jgi:hypothetical protein
MTDAVAERSPVNFKVVDAERGDALFRRPAVKWAGPMTALLSGETVFIPAITRSGLETLRGMLAERTTLRLRSRATTVDEQEGLLLRLVPR